MAGFARSTKFAAPLAVGAGPEEVVLVDAGGYTATASAEFTVLGSTEAIEVTWNYVKTGTAPSVTFQVEQFDVAANAFIPVLASAAVVATGTGSLIIGPGVQSVANISKPAVIRQRMRVTATHGNTDVATYSLSVASGNAA